MALNPDLFTALYKPDVLMCLADLSNDEVFTPPDIANQVLDMLPQELFRDPNTKFLDPALKSGVFLREIAKRLIAGLADKIPNLQDRCDHIFKNQLYGIAITELTSLLGRRSVYCSKYPNSPFSITKFENVQGNILYRKMRHRWDHAGANGKCIFCGTAYDGDLGDINREGLETHAYEFIHTIHPEEIFNMKFDVICSNPPYQLSTGGGQQNSAKQAKPIYNMFVEQAKKLNPRYITMIIPSRWFAGGMGLDAFRKNMISDHHISQLVDFPNAKDCFPQNSISGGVCYFLWERDKKVKECNFTSVSGDNRNTLCRPLDEFGTLVRYNDAVNIIHKVFNKNEDNIVDLVSSISPFGLTTKERGTEKKVKPSDVKMYSSSGVSYISEAKSFLTNKYYNCYKVMVSQTSAEHAGEPGKDGMFRVLTSSMKVIEPKDVCTHSYILVGPMNTKQEADNLCSYLKTKFVRFLLLQMMTSIHISKNTFAFVPAQDFRMEWTDEQLYQKYSLTEEEISFIESMIRPMDVGGGE